MHYFACNYYTAMGQLRDSTKRSRRSKKARRKRKLQESEDGGEAAEPPNKASDNDSSTEEESSSSSDSEDDGEEGDGASVGYRPQTRRRRERRTSPDMYKAFDGSALMAICKLIFPGFTLFCSLLVTETFPSNACARARRVST